jgi:phage internal scaffolding protein
MKKPVVRKALERHKGSTVDTGRGLTEQSHKKETDMNYILREYTRTGLVRHAKNNEGKYDDIAVQDFQEAMITVANAKTMFEELPAAIRKRFNQNPAEFLGFVQNPANLNEMQKMGILRGNDGLNIKGAPVAVPTQADLPTPSPEGTKPPEGV